MAATIPSKMRAVFLTAHLTDYTDDDTSANFEVKEVDVPQPRSGEVLVKIECSPINPSDLSTLTGTYNKSQRGELPCQLGYEASGTVVKSGGGFFGWMVNGKRVGVVTKGNGIMWAEYAVVPAIQCMALPAGVSFERGCSCYVNPMTAVSFVEIAQERGLNSIVHTAAASALGRMLVKYAASKGVDVVCVVRREEQAEILRAIGAKHIVVSTNDGWEAELKKICEENKTLLGFDAVAGELAGQIIHAMPKGSELQVYGGLSKQPISGMTSTDLIFQNKKLSGFWLTPRLGAKSLWAKKNLADEVAANLLDYLGSDVRASFPLERVADAVKDYTQNMSKGKVIITPNLAATEGGEISL
eukprot:TRINITY_DN11334_c0_g1_i1.p1 TRINITY_DN11334_c0_g1~~TRINITY_DN11334_c0_g1_i1.p1  ORF type:complete len:376 (+),score=117.41 TRINITY_DN11334_c0_g1_i1:60-1130(+)